MTSFRFLLLGTALALGGCSGTTNHGVESVHQPAVSRAAYAFDVAAGPGGLAPGERARLAGWLAAMRLRYGDEIGVDGGGNDDRSATADVAAEAARVGLLLTDSVPPTPGTIAPGTIRVVVSRMTAAVPGCPDASRTYQPNPMSQTSSDFGCAVNTNLAAMVARPGDFVLGQSATGTTDTMVNSKAVGALRTAKPTGDGGKIGETVGSVGGGNRQ